jgi:hypothetical protein
MAHSVLSPPKHLRQENSFHPKNAPKKEVMKKVQLNLKTPRLEGEMSFFLRKFLDRRRNINRKAFFFFPREKMP